MAVTLMLQENNARKGFFEAHEFQAVLAALPDTLKPVAEVAYVTGWRIRAELLTRRWSNVTSTPAGSASNRARRRTGRDGCSR
jgi:hypothetical protein